MIAIIKHLHEAALNPHLTDKAFRLSVISAVENRDENAHESYDEAFLRFSQEAIYAYEREMGSRAPFMPPPKPPPPRRRRPKIEIV